LRAALVPEESVIDGAANVVGQGHASECGPLPELIGPLGIRAKVNPPPARFLFCDKGHDLFPELDTYK
jgi:hypothetical protein